ncbi:MAG: hypothetical protein LBH44_09635 [Treponema sp.]|jgi:hypothetical protein|nr:hypothetical protein [Treponema sp.]
MKNAGASGMIVLITVLLLLGCITAPSASPGIWVAGISETLTRYYIPATKWQEEADRLIMCRPDMTYINEPGRAVVCNISFLMNDAVPTEITSLSFSADSGIYPLNDVSLMFVRTEYKEQRITSTIEISELLHLFQSEKIMLNAVIDSVEYTFRPDKEFMLYRSQFLEQIH